MIYRHTQEQVDAYYVRTDVNQSSLKIILERGMQYYLDNLTKLTSKEEVYEEVEHFIIGGAVDCRITMGEDVFREKYHLTNLKKKPGPGAMAVVKRAYNVATQQFPLGLDIDIGVYREYLYQAANEEEFNMRSASKTNSYSDDSRVIKLIKECKEYWADLVLSEGKQVLDEDQTKVVEVVYNSLMGHSHTSAIFTNKKYYTDKVDVVYQFPIYFTYQGVACKAMLDKVIIDHESKRILPIDIKTTMDYILRFTKAIVKHRYDIQASFYTHALTQHIHQLGSIISKSIEGYSYANLAFIAESTIHPGCPLIYITNSEVIELGRKGYTKPDGSVVGGWETALNTYLTWQKYDFDINKVMANNRGIIHLNQSSLFNGYEYN